MWCFHLLHGNPLMAQKRLVYLSFLFLFPFALVAQTDPDSFVTTESGDNQGCPWAIELDIYWLVEENLGASADIEFHAKATRDSGCSSFHLSIWVIYEDLSWPLSYNPTSHRKLVLNLTNGHTYKLKIRVSQSATGDREYFEKFFEYDLFHLDLDGIAQPPPPLQECEPRWETLQDVWTADTDQDIEVWWVPESGPMELIDSGRALSGEPINLYYQKYGCGIFQVRTRPVTVTDSGEQYGEWENRPGNGAGTNPGDPGGGQPIDTEGLATDAKLDEVITAINNVGAAIQNQPGDPADPNDPQSDVTVVNMPEDMATETTLSAVQQDTSALVDEVQGLREDLSDTGDLDLPEQPDQDFPELDILSEQELSDLFQPAEFEVSEEFAFDGAAAVLDVLPDSIILPDFTTARSYTYSVDFPDELGGELVIDLTPFQDSIDFFRMLVIFVLGVSTWMTTVLIIRGSSAG